MTLGSSPDARRLARRMNGPLPRGSPLGGKAASSRALRVTPPPRGASEQKAVGVAFSSSRKCECEVTMWFGRLCLLAACHPVYTKRQNVHAHQWRLAVDFMHRTDGDIIETEHPGHDQPH